MGTEENKALVRRFFRAIDEACKEGNADILDEFLAPDFVEHNPFPGIPPTREGWKQAFKMFVDGAPGYHVVEDLVAERDKVAGRITRTGRTKETSSAFRERANRSGWPGWRFGGSNADES